MTNNNTQTISKIIVTRLNVDRRNQALIFGLMKIIIKAELIVAIDKNTMATIASLLIQN
jgi:hypothetical protein